MNSETNKSLSQTEKHRLRELEQEVEIMGEYISLLGDTQTQQKTTNQQVHEKKESEQEKFILVELNKVLEEKAELEVGQFMDILSQKLNNPLNPIRKYVEMLNDETFGELGEKQKQKLKKVDDDSRDTIQLINNMSMYQQYSLGKQHLNKEIHDIKKIIHEAHLFFSSELESHGMKINSTFSKPLPIMCDSKQMFQVFTNLLQMAFYSVPGKSGKIIVNVWEKENEVEISISHNGINTPHEALNKIFSNSYKVDTTNLRTNGGIGLSLTLCRQIIDSHGGKMWHENKDNFVTVKFTLPKI